MPDFIGGPIVRQKKGQPKKYSVFWKAPIRKDGTIARNGMILVFPGGMEHPAEHGDLERTFREEIEEETSLRIREGAQVHRYPVTAEHVGHTKYFVWVWRRDCKGKIRNVHSVDGKTWLSRVLFVDKLYLEKHLHGDYRLVLPFLEG